MTSPVAFVEDKRPDLPSIGTLLQASAARNHWTNFGPVWEQLKAHTETALDSSERIESPCLARAAPMHCLRRRRSPSGSSERRWIVSAYGFRATVIGPFANTIVIDCDENGIIDVGRLVDRSNDYDGIVATNPFGLLADLNDARSISLGSTHKALIIDNAAAFVGFDRSDHAGVFECLSFHHTKPYGFGEGGCLIVDRVLQDRARSVLGLRLSL